jgi:hypothetical protein
MREWLDEAGPRLLGLICFLTVLNTLLLVGLYFRIDPAQKSAPEPEQAQVTGEAPLSGSPPPPSSQRVPLSTSNLPDFFTKMMEPFGDESEGLVLPSEAQIQTAIQSGDFNSPEAQEAFGLLKEAYSQSNRPLPPIE